jgi:hypothetical protein
MPTIASVGPDSRLATALAGAALVVGVGLLASGVALHLRVSGTLATGTCDGCEPWHPLFVVAPLVVGSALALVGGGALARD